VTAADGCVILHFVFYLYFVFLLLPTWPIEPDDEPDDKFTVILFFTRVIVFHGEETFVTSLVAAATQLI